MKNLNVTLVVHSVKEFNEAVPDLKLPNADNVTVEATIDIAGSYQPLANARLQGQYEMRDLIAEMAKGWSGSLESLAAQIAQLNPPILAGTFFK